MLYYTILYYTILYYNLLYILYDHYTILYYTILYHTIPYYTILYHTIPYHTILYYTILYYTILYHTIDRSRAARWVRCLGHIRTRDWRTAIYKYIYSIIIILCYVILSYIKLLVSWALPHQKPQDGFEWPLIVETTLPILILA